VAGRYFQDAARVVVAVGPARELRRQLERFGEVRVVPARRMS